VRVKEAFLIDRIRAMMAGIPDLIARIQKQIEAEGLSHPTITPLARRRTGRATFCQKLLEMCSR
jgi:hypothetical protein